MSQMLKSLGWLWKVSLVVAVSVMIPFSLSVLEKSDYTTPAYGQWGTGGNTDTTYYISGFNVGASEPGQRIVGSYADFDTLVGAVSGLPGSVRDTVLVVYTDTMSVSVHDTANAVRAAIRDTVADMDQIAGYKLRLGVIDSVSTYVAAEDVKGVYQADGYLYIACGDGGLVSCSIAGGVLTQVDSLGDPTTAVWGTGSHIFTANLTTARNYSVTAGVMTIVDSATGLPDNGLSIFSVPYLDSIWVYISDDDGQIITLSALGDDITYKTTKVAHNSGVGKDVWASANRVYMANREYGVYAFRNDGEGTLTQIDNEDPGTDWCESVWGDGNYLYAAYSTLGIRTYARASDGTLTDTDGFDPGDYSTSIYSDGEWVYLGTNTFAEGIIAFDVDDWGNVMELDRFTTPEAPVIANGLIGDGTYVYVAGSTSVFTYQYYTPWLYDPEFSRHNFVGRVDIPDSLVVGDYPGGTYSLAIAGADWAVSSSQSLKVLDKPFTQALGSQVLDEIAQLPIQTWQFRNGDGSQHVGPTAEDWYKVARLVAPKSAKPTEINGSHQTAALLLSIQELNRLNYAQEQELADLRQRITLLELESPLYDK